MGFDDTSFDDTINGSFANYVHLWVGLTNFRSVLQDKTLRFSPFNGFFVLPFSDTK